MLPPPPGYVFNRAAEWQGLARFAADASGHPALGVVYGRRRQGKSFLLRALCREMGGFCFEAPEATEAEALRLLGQRLAEHLKVPGRLAFDGWPAAVAALMDLGAGDRPVPVVLDEFPRLARECRSLPSLIQAALPPRTEDGSACRTRLILCGSALSFMTRLLSGESPLRGRASLELMLHPFDYRQAAAFWGLHDQPALAFRVYAVVGGTPAYRREFVSDDVPRGGDFDDWVLRTALNPMTPLFREGRYLLAEEPDLRDLGLYHSVLAAISEGSTTRGSIAAALGRASTDVGHPLAVLEDTGFVERRQDTFRRGGSTWHVAEPIVRFHHAITRPSWSAWQDRATASALWKRAQETFRSRLLGPAFEDVCRTWVRRYASVETMGDVVVEVGSGVVQDARARARHEVDIVAFGLPDPGGRRRVLLIGEAKWGKKMGMEEVRRLARVRELLRARDDVDASGCRIGCFSGVGFESVAAQEAAGALLVDGDRLYQGS